MAERLRWYWQMEAANILLLPAAVLVGVWSFGGSVGLALALSIVANIVLLAIGACYWRIVFLRVEGNGAAFVTWIPRLAKAEPLAIVLVVVAVAATCADIVLGDGTWPPERVASIAMATLAILEYVNYYRVQLQYFDNRADFNGLFRKKVLKRAHMARDIAAWRGGQRKRS